MSDWLTPDGREIVIVRRDPDWVARFQDIVGDLKGPFYLREDEAFETVMREWRRWYWTPIFVSGELKRMPASATDAIIALAQVGVMPPRSLDPDPLDPEESKLKRPSPIRKDDAE